MVNRYPPCPASDPGVPMTWIHRGVLRSHILTVLSWEPETTISSEEYNDNTWPENKTERIWTSGESVSNLWITCQSFSHKMVPKRGMMKKSWYFSDWITEWTKQWFMCNKIWPKLNGKKMPLFSMLFSWFYRSLLHNTLNWSLFEMTMLGLLSSLSTLTLDTLCPYFLKFL